MVKIDFSKHNTDVLGTLDPDFTSGEYKLHWPERASKYIEEMLTNALIGEALSGPVSSIAKRAINDIYTSSGLSRIVDETTGYNLVSNNLLVNITEQILEALVTAGDYALVRSSFYKILSAYYLSNSTKSEEQLSDPTYFEKALKYYVTIRVIRFVTTKREKEIRRGIEARTE